MTTRRELLTLVPRYQVELALRSGEIVRDAHGRYALPLLDDSRRAASALAGVGSHLVAAQFWAWEVKTPPRSPVVTVPRNRKIAPERRDGVEVHWADLRADETHEWVTSRDRTFIDCAKTLPFPDALAVADSALRHGMTRDQLIRLAEAVPGKGRGRCQHVARAADGGAANPFESVLRSIALKVPGLHVVPQVKIVDGDFFARPDLVDETLRLVLEADSFAFHSSPQQLERDCARYTALTLRGWRVLRFSWRNVMLEPAYVRACLMAAVQVPGHLPPVPVGIFR